ncbi:hypothetical protein IWQ61_000562 [Dispira simplex]|nr:hypothetical protein IWQ61_000562 [Dispira simplex]
MKLARFTALGVVVTYLSGSVWATEKLTNPESNREFCLAFWLRHSFEKYDESITQEKLDELRKLAITEENTRDLNELSPEETIGAAKVFLLEETYLKSRFLVEVGALNEYTGNPLSSNPYRYYIAAKASSFSHIREIMEASEAKEFAESYKMDEESGLNKGISLQSFRLNTTNPVEAKAAEFITGCTKWQEARQIEPVDQSSFPDMET